MNFIGPGISIKFFLLIEYRFLEFFQIDLITHTKCIRWWTQILEQQPKHSGNQNQIESLFEAKTDLKTSFEFFWPLFSTEPNIAISIFLSALNEKAEY